MIFCALRLVNFLISQHCWPNWFSRNNILSIKLQVKLFVCFTKEFHSYKEFQFHLNFDLWNKRIRQDGNSIEMNTVYLRYWKNQLKLDNVDANNDAKFCIHKAIIRRLRLSHDVLRNCKMKISGNKSAPHAVNNSMCNQKCIKKTFYLVETRQPISEYQMLFIHFFYS